MKKSILPLAVALLLIPQILISQDSMEVSNDISFDFAKELASDDELTPKGGDIKEITSLNSFELLQESDNNMKIVASFAYQESFEVKIYNDNGINIYQENFNTDELSLAMGFSNLPKGEYFISIKAEDGEVIKPFK